MCTGSEYGIVNFYFVFEVHCNRKELNLRYCRFDSHHHKSPNAYLAHLSPKQPTLSFSSTTVPQTDRSLLRMTSASGSSTDDPLAHVLAPPPNESVHERDDRMRAEAEAKKRSDAIDEEINKQRTARKTSRPVKILLLGESIISPVCFRSLTCHTTHTRSKRIRCAQLSIRSLDRTLNPHLPPAVGKSTTLKSQSVFVHLREYHLTPFIRGVQTSS